MNKKVDRFGELLANLSAPMTARLIPQRRVWIAAMIASRSLCIPWTVQAATTLPSSSFLSPQSPRSVYRINPWVDGPIIGAATLGTALPYAFSDRLISRRCPCPPYEVNGFDRSAIGNENNFLDGLSDVTVGLAMIAPLALDLADVGASRVFLEDAVVFVEVMSVNGALTTFAKYTVQRPLPLVYAGQDPELAAQPGGFRSFYSGHTSSTLAALSATSMTLGYRHGTGIWPWVVTAGVGTAVAMERVAAGRHFPTDVIVGAFAGSIVGTAVPWLHHRTDDLHLSVRGALDGDRGLGLAWNYRF